ncbi:MAG: hypothetical protein JW862_01640 [Anaerolineales bacterium]|nr:hypothetical protein [Anaerolineales bacterium]
MRRSIQFLLVTLILVISLSGAQGAQAQFPEYFNIFCNADQPQLTISNWLAEENLTVFVDGVQVDQFSTDASGAATYIFPAPGLHTLALQRANGETILAGQADCATSLPEIGRIEVDPFDVSAPIGTSVSLVAQGLSDTGEPLAVNLLWMASAGSIDAQGNYQATELGQHLLMVSLIGPGRSYNSLIQATITPPPVRIEIEPAELYVPVGNTFRLLANGVDAEGNRLPIQASWSSTPEGISPDGFFEAAPAGDYTVTASLDAFDLQASATVKVYVPLEQISIQPEVTELVVGDSLQFELLGSDLAGNPAELFNPPLWSAALGEIDANGFYQATTAGDETITVNVNPAPGQSRRGFGGVLAGPINPLVIIWEFLVLPPPAPVNEQEPPEQEAPDPESESLLEEEPTGLIDFPADQALIGPGGSLVCLGAAGLSILALLFWGRKHLTWLKALPDFVFWLLVALLGSAVVIITALVGTQVNLLDLGNYLGAF